MPERIQLRRTRGWRLPAGAINVARPTRWGNPYQVRMAPVGWMVVGNGTTYQGTIPGLTRAEATRYAVDRYRDLYPEGSINAYDARVLLAGKDLACWCPPGTPCHGDILLEIANAAGNG